MRYKMFTIYDSKVEAFCPPFFHAHNGDALREFEEMANDPKSKICNYAQDYSLFEIGSFDNSNSSITMLTSPISLALAVEVKRADRTGGLLQSVG